MSYEIDLKPTFLNQLTALPQKEVAHVMDKVRILQEAPAPDSKSKKRLVGYKGAVYRIRSGNYRILYTFNESEGWVVLLGVDNRKDVYKGEQLVAEEPGYEVATMPDAADLLAIETHPTFDSTPTLERRSAEDDLPVRIDAELLTRLRVPEQFVQALVGCTTIDDFLAADVPEAVRTRVFDVVTSPDYDRVMQQPTFVADDVDDLLRFAWVEAEDPAEYLEFSITTSPITDETILTITDFCDDDEVQDQKLFWESQIKKMTHVMGG